MGIAANFHEEAIGVVEVNPASGGATDGAVIDRHLMMVEDGDGAIEVFGGDVKGEMVGAGKLGLGIGVWGGEFWFPK